MRVAFTHKILYIHIGRVMYICAHTSYMNSTDAFVGSALSWKGQNVLDYVLYLCASEGTYPGEGGLAIRPLIGAARTFHVPARITLIPSLLCFSLKCTFWKLSKPQTGIPGMDQTDNTLATVNYRLVKLETLKHSGVITSFYKSVLLTTGN